LLSLVYHLCFWSTCNIVLRCFVCSSSFLEYMRIYSRNNNKNLSKYSLNTLFMRHMNVVNALVRSNGTTVNSQWPYWVMKSILWMSSSLILTWWYPHLNSIFENTLAPFIWSNRSSILGMEIYYWLWPYWAACSQYTVSRFHLFSLWTTLVHPTGTHLVWCTSYPSILETAFSILLTMECSFCKELWTLGFLLEQE